MDDFDLSDHEDSFNVKRLNVEWATLNAIRELLGIALKGSESPTYEQSLSFAKSVAPKIFSSPETVIGRTSERPLVEEYRQKTLALSRIENRDVSPTEFIDKDIQDIKKLLQAESQNDLLFKRLTTLESTRALLANKRYTENQLILRDLFKVKRDLPSPPIDGDTYQEFRISDDRGLRIRLLHPDKAEHIVGADLIYETYWDKRHVMRLALVQYKIWDGKVLYTSQTNNLEEQLAKLKHIFCAGQLCKNSDKSARNDSYRLPFCVAFLRPTDAIQSPDSRFISSGLHIPICVVEQSWEETGRGGKKLESKKIRSQALSHKVFEELFNTNMLGSRWLTYEEIDELYKKHRILNADESVVIHAQEFGISE
jgi:hypothetical protein